MLTAKGLKTVEEMRVRVRTISQADGFKLFNDPGIRGWQKELATMAGDGMDPDGVVRKFDARGNAIRREHLEDDDIPMIQGNLSAYLNGRGFKK